VLAGWATDDAAAAARRIVLLGIVDLDFLLLRNLLDGHEALLSHLDALGHVADSGVFLGREEEMLTFFGWSR
jgi:hypothetical protein